MSLIEIPLSFQNTKYMVYENDNNHCLLLNSIPLTSANKIDYKKLENEAVLEYNKEKGKAKKLVKE